MSPPDFCPSLKLEASAQALREGETLPHTVQNVVLSCFGFGLTLMGTLRRGMAGLHVILKAFDGSGAGVPSSSARLEHSSI